MKKKVFFIVMLTSKIFKTQHLHIIWKIQACFSVVFITPYLMHHSCAIAYFSGSCNFLTRLLKNKRNSVLEVECCFTGQLYLELLPASSIL